MRLVFWAVADQIIKKLFDPLHHEKVIFTEVSFSDCIYSLIPFWSISVVLNGIENELEYEFESSVGPKVYFKCWGEKSIFHWKIGHPFKLNI